MLLKRHTLQSLLHLDFLLHETTNHLIFYSILLLILINHFSRIYIFHYFILLASYFL